MSNLGRSFPSGRRARREQFLLDERIGLLEAQLKIAIGTHRGIDGIATWKWQESDKLNQKRFEAEQPEMYQMYVERQSTRVLRLERR